MRQRSPHTAMLWVVASGFFMQTLDTTIVNTALPSIAQSLGVAPLALQPVIVAYTLTMALLTPASGWLADRFGTRHVYFAAILVFTIGSVCCAMASTLPMLVAARVVQGVGGSMLLPVGRLAVLRTITGEQYVAALASISIAGQVGPIVGPVLGGWFVQAISWHWIFLINVPIGLVGLVAVRRFLPQDAQDDPPRFDWLGCGLLSTAMVAFTLALESHAGAHTVGRSLALLALSIAAVLLYIPHARRDRVPLFRLGLFREPNFSVGLAGNLVCRIGSAAIPFLAPLLLQLELGYSPLGAGLMLLPAALAGTLAKGGIAPLVRRFGYPAFLRVNTVVVGLAIIGFATITPATPLAVTIAIMAVFGAGNSMQFAAMNSVTLKGLTVRDAGSGNSLFSMVQMLAVGLGVSVSGGLVQAFTGHVASPLMAFRASFACMGIVTLLSALVFRHLDAPPRR